MRKWISGVTIAAASVIASAAWAGDIFTPVLNAGTTGGIASLVCSVLNTGKAEVEGVTISIHLGGNGSTTASNTFDIPPDAERSLFHSALPGSANFYCRVSGISKGKAKVSLCALETSGTCKVIVTP